MFKSYLPVALFLSIAAAPFASAQVIYAPVQYQYGPGPTFYYGGSDPRVFERAAQSACVEYGSSGTGWHEGKPGVGLIRPDLLGRPPYRVYNDCIRDNAGVYGFTPADARNEANARAPRYFIKADLLAAAVPAYQPDYFEKRDVAGLLRRTPGVMVVPAQPPPVGLIDIHPTGRRSTTTQPATPTTEPKPILIIPKRLLQQPAGDKPVATIG